MEEVDNESIASEEAHTACVSARSFEGKPPTFYGVEEFMCLKRGRYLNDDTVEFIMCNLAQKYRVLCLSPRFYTTLVSANDDQAQNDQREPFVNAARSRIAYKKVEKWYTDVFQHDLVFIPVVKGHHWTLLVVCYPWATPETVSVVPSVCDGSDVSSRAVCWIMAFDSSSKLNWVSEEYVNPVRDYLTVQWVRECGGNLRDVDFSLMRMVKMVTPQQKNKCDCGLYVLRAAEAVAMSPPKMDVLLCGTKERGLRMMYASAIRRVEMNAYREELKALVKKCSEKEGLWKDEWNDVF